MVRPKAFLLNRVELGEARAMGQIRSMQGVSLIERDSKKIYVLVLS
jgi:hypothetical protein